MREAKAWVRKSHRTKHLHPSKQRWEVIYEDPHHPTKPPYTERTKGGFPTKAAAEDWAKDHRDRTRSGAYTDPIKGTATLSEVAARWVEATPFKRINTERSTRGIIDGQNHLTRTFGDVPIGDITYGSVLHFIKTMSAERSAQTVRHQFYVLRTVLDYAVEERLIPANPAQLVKPKMLPTVKKVREHEEKRHPLTLAETERIIEAMPYPYDVFTRLVAFTGMRPEEATALTLDDVDLIEGTLTVRSVLVESTGQVEREHFAKSDAGKRTIDLDTRTLDVLDDYIAKHRRRATAWLREHPNQPHYGAEDGEALPLFVGLRNGGRTAEPVLDRLDYSKPMRYSAFNKGHWHRARRAAGVPASVRFYDLRHQEVSRFVARMARAEEFDIKEIQERYGHVSAVMTLDRYGHKKKVNRAARRREIDAGLAAQRAREGGAENVTPITERRRAN